VARRGILATAFLGTLVASIVSSRSAEAQISVFSTNTGNNLNIEHYQPTTLGLSTVEASRSQRWREYAVGLYLNYARDPLVLFADRLQIGEVVAHRVSQDIVGSMGITNWLEVALVIPLTYYQTGDKDLPTGSIAHIGMRDIRVQPKFTIATQDVTGLIGIAFVPELSLPTGNSSAFLGDGNIVFAPHLVFDRTLSLLWGLRAGLATGVRLRPRAEIGNISIGNEVFYRLGVGVGLPNLFDRHPEAIAEATGVSRLSDLFKNREQNAIIGTLALRLRWDLEAGHRIFGIGGVNVGTTQGYGSPDFQIFTGIVYQHYLSDRDNDGIIDEDDACPDDPEDKDGFEDEDGCPDPDNDKDGIPDVADKCPNDPEDKDGFEDLDGCPDLDNDKDGIPDVKDKCPNEPEDFDGFEDEDGCPDPDNDHDGIPDDKDKCPNEKETINGVDDEDGCPDEGDPHVEVTSEKVTIDTKIQFDFDSAVIKSESYSILNQVALTLLANPQLKKIRVEGHTDERGTDAYNLVLSQRRAESVMQYLIGRNVPSERLEAVGYGESKPLAQGHDEAAWYKNRRVEFTILEQQDVDTTNPTITPPVN
jgi:outer membrane protein OmpA-like peptidoglycan-associated protein